MYIQLIFDFKRFASKMCKLYIWIWAKSSGKNEIFYVSLVNTKIFKQIIMILI